MEKTGSWTSSLLRDSTNGIWYNDVEPSDDLLQDIHIDSRRVTKGSIFIAINGARFDGHDFVKESVERGCAVIIVERVVDDAQVAQLIVDDTTKALGQLGAIHRSRMPSLTVFALTGSSGKTTTKEMLGSILSLSGNTLITQGNLNNHIGVPLMLLQLTPKHRYAVFELGANHQGEIQYTSSLVKPDVGGVLQIGTAHMGLFGGREEICRAKAEIYGETSAEGTSIVPSNDEFTPQLTLAVRSKKMITFGEDGKVFASEVHLHPESSEFSLHTPDGRHQSVHLQMSGIHNLQNAVAAAAFAIAIDIPLSTIVEGLESSRSLSGRQSFIHHGRYTFIDDSYNANPSSMRAAAEVLLKQEGKKIFVIGDMYELGDHSNQEHFNLGTDVSRMDIDYTIAIGKLSSQVIRGSEEERPLRYERAWGSVKGYTTKEEALPVIRKMLEEDSEERITILFKGSHSMHLHTMIEDIRQGLQ